MGNGASARLPKTFIKRENIRDRNRLVRSVEKFIIFVNSSCSRTDSMWYILCSKSKYMIRFIYVFRCHV